MAGEVFVCPMCGAEIPDKTACAPSCPLAAGCAQVCCPNCGYTTTDASKTRTGSWLMRLLGVRPDHRSPR